MARPLDQNYAAQILLEQGTYKISDDGRLTYEHRLIFRVDSNDGVKGWSEISANWDPWYEKPSQLHARVLQADGRFAELDQKTITDAPVKAQEDDTYSSSHVRRAPLPAVTVGAIVEEVEITEEKIPYFTGGEVYRFGFQQNVPIAQERLVVDLPIDMPFKDSLRNLPGISVTRSELGQRRRILYEQASIDSRHVSDIDLSTNFTPAPEVEFATGVSWGKVATEYAKLADPQTITADVQAIMPKTLPEDRAGKIRAILSQLHHEVRYTGVEFGQARLTPQRPSEVLNRHYGDCKDKATLLVAMLRSAGIQADLALLSTGPGWDVNPALPGMNLFDHAIVHIAAAPGNGGGPLDGDMFVDATAEYYEAGTLPYEDQGRYALLIAPGTKELTKTPAPTAADSVLLETRTFTLSEFGPSRIEESSDTHGYIDANYRSNYGGIDGERTRADMLGYVQRAYLAKSLTSLSHGDGTDFQHSFHLKLTADGAKRGISTMSEALVAIFPAATISSLPKWFSTPPPVVGPDTPEFEKHEKALAEQSRAETYTIRPFTSEQRSRILVPEGFVLRSLPTDKVTKLGTATLTETYKSDPGIVTADFKFETGEATLTVDQALAMRSAILELNKREYVGIYFDQIGAKALAAGHIREALESDRALIAAHPQDAIHHVRLARALLDAGIGNEAHAEARIATQLDPKSGIAFSTLGWTLEHSNLGDRFGKGYDRPGAIAAYKQAIALDPDDRDARFDLGILYEFNARGVRYAPDADLAAALETYRALIDRAEKTDPQAAAQYRENMLYVLLYTRQFSELDKLLATLPANIAHTTLAISSETAQHGAATGIAAAAKGNVSSTERNNALRTAGSQLAGLHLYADAAEVMSAGMQGGQDVPGIARQIELYRSVKPASLKPLPSTNPASPVQSITFGAMAGTLTSNQIESALSNQAYTSDAAKQRDIKKTLSTSGFLRAVSLQSQIAEPVLLDLVAGNMSFTSDGDDKVGYSVSAISPGSEPSHFYVVKEHGSYRIIADEHDNVQVGNAVLSALKQQDLTQAKAILDWKRGLTHKAGSDDDFAGPLLPRFWTVGSTKPGADSPETMHMAAIALIVGSMEAKAYLQEIAAAREKAAGQSQTDLDILLAVAGVGAEQPEAALPAAKRLMELEPDSQTALRLAGECYAIQHDPKGWQAMLAPRLARKPKDHDLLVQQSRAFASAHDFVAAQDAQQKVLDSGKAEPSDYNLYAWLGLFDGKLGEETSKAAQQGSMMAKNASFAELHTLACVYAAQGKTTEARQVLQQAMYAGTQAEPNSAVWYALGLIYEQYGAKSAALDAYHRVEAHELDDHTFIDPTSTYVLAQERISKLGS